MPKRTNRSLIGLARGKTNSNARIWIPCNQCESKNEKDQWADTNWRWISRKLAKEVIICGVRKICEWLQFGIIALKLKKFGYQSLKWFPSSALPDDTISISSFWLALRTALRNYSSEDVDPDNVSASLSISSSSSSSLSGHLRMSNK